MTRRMNRMTVDVVDDFLIRENTGSITKTAFGTSSNLFQHIDEVKTVNGWLQVHGLDPFKRGTKEPAAIKEALAGARWAEVKDSAKVGVSMWD